MSPVARGAFVISDPARDGPVFEIRVRNGEPFRLDEGELDLAQAMANVAALALDGARTRQATAVS